MLYVQASVQGKKRVSVQLARERKEKNFSTSGKRTAQSKFRILKKKETVKEIVGELQKNGRFGGCVGPRKD